VFVNERDNASVALVANGWAKVRAPGGQQSPYYEDLVKAQEAAEAKAVGLHTKVRNRRAVAGVSRDGDSGTRPIGRQRLAKRGWCGQDWGQALGVQLARQRAIGFHGTRSASTCASGRWLGRTPVCSSAGELAAGGGFQLRQPWLGEVRMQPVLHAAPQVMAIEVALSD
jgi:hypothetical protein